MLSDAAKAISEGNNYFSLPKSCKRTGYSKTPYVLINPHGEVISNSIIIYCHGLHEIFEQTVGSIAVISEITKIPLIYFEYCGFYRDSTYSNSNLLCSLLDIYDLATNKNKAMKVYILGNLEGAMAAMDLVDCCRKQKYRVDGVVLINPMGLKTTKYKLNKFNCRILVSTRSTHLEIARKLNKKFKESTIAQFETDKLNLMDEETDSVLSHITEVITAKNPEYKGINGEEVVIDKPPMYRDPFEVIHEFVTDEELSQILLNNGYYSPDIISMMSQDEKKGLGLTDRQSEELDEIIVKIQKEKRGRIAPNTSLFSSVTLTPRVDPQLIVDYSSCHDKGRCSVSLLYGNETPRFQGIKHTRRQTGSPMVNLSPLSPRTPNTVGQLTIGSLSRGDVKTPPLISLEGECKDPPLSPKRKRNETKRRGGSWVVIDDKTLSPVIL